jgi:hypothetical protein|tara:strand:- start:207 stop:353 length:147 start_codon:yes stop_codon:yes gene_type:complete
MKNKQNIFEVIDKLIKRNNDEVSNKIEEGEILEGLRKYIKNLVPKLNF